jgi:lipopolysaccharide/colanic/teichoic acid biosynthesis glycosyltransferase
VSLVLLVALSPLLAVVYLLVRFGLGPPVFFVQRRPGLGGRPFDLVKFRTMTAARDSSGRLLLDAQRLGRLGRFLRQFSLDELPELWNVARGEMSLVGPRPLLMQYLDRYTPEQARRHEVKPGITGWAQVNGRNTLPWEERFRMDLWYIENRSFALDIKILALTVLKTLRHEGINEPGEATAREFMGASDGQRR